MSPIGLATVVTQLTARSRILDDNYHHVITLYEDRISRGVRLAATIWNGPCKRSPIWTAFLTASDIKKTFIKPSGSNKVLLKQLDINTYTNAGYDFRKQTTQRGCFKLQFVENDG